MRARSIRHLFLAIAAILLSASLLQSSPTSQPSIATLLARLSDVDPEVRDSSRQQLMGLTPADLPALRRAVQTACPLRPGAGEVVKDIVQQIFLTGETADSVPGRGFMGVKMMQDADAVHTDDDGESDLPLGVVVEGRIPGFAAYRMLRDGDLILSIATPTLLPDAIPETPAKMQEHRVRLIGEISDMIGVLPAGEEVVLVVLRAGHRVEVPLKLGARPRELMQGPFDAYDHFREDQIEKAERFWREQFASLIDDSMS